MVMLLAVLMTLSITACASNLYLSKTSVTLEAGASETVTASTKEGGDKAEGVTWTSDKPEVATVDGGKITGVAKGTAVITAALNGKSVTVNVTVNDTLGDYKASKKTELDTHAAAKIEADYTAAKWTELQNAVTAGKTAIDSAADSAAVDTALTAAKNAVDAVSTKVPASIVLGAVSGTVAESQPVATSAYGHAPVFDNSAYPYVDASLIKGDADYSHVRFMVSVNTADAVQLFARDTANNWYNVVITGWGPAEGFPIADATTRFYVVGLKAGTHTVTMQLIDINNDNVLISETAQITVIKPLSIEMGAVSGTITETQAVATTAAQAAAFDETKYRHVDISLHKGVATHTNVRFTVNVDTAGALQLFAQDTNGKWWNAVESGWGPPEGFAVADATTRFYVVGIKPGTHTVTISLVDVGNANSVIQTKTAEVTVAAA